MTQRISRIGALFVIASSLVYLYAIRSYDYPKARQRDILNQQFHPGGERCYRVGDDFFVPSDKGSTEHYVCVAGQPNTWRLTTIITNNHLH